MTSTGVSGPDTSAPTQSWPMTGSPTLSMETSTSRRWSAVAVAGITPLISAMAGPAVAKSGVITPRKRPRSTTPTTTRKTVRGLFLNQRLMEPNSRESDRRRGLVLAEDGPQGPADLPERRLRTHGVEDARHQRRVRRRGLLDRCERHVDSSPVAPGAMRRESRGLLGHGAFIRAEEQWGSTLLGLGVPVDADNDLISDRDRALGAVRLVLDELLHPSGLDARDRAAALVDLVEEPASLTFELVGEPFDVVRTTQRVDRVGHAGLLGDDLLRPHGDALRLLGRDGERLVVAGQRERLNTTEHRRECLDGGSDDVVLRLLRGECRTARLRVRAQHERARVARVKSFGHGSRPEASQGSVLGDLLEEIDVGVEDPGELGREVVHADAAFDRCLHVGTRVGDGERPLLCGGASRLADVEPGD